MTKFLIGAVAVAALAIVLGISLVDTVHQRRQAAGEFDRLTYAQRLRVMDGYAPAVDYAGLWPEKRR